MHVAYLALLFIIQPPDPSSQGEHEPLPLTLSDLDEFRNLDGSKNNPSEALWGIAGSTLVRLVPAAYSDGIQAPSGAGLASAREISQVVCAQSDPIPNALGASDFVWQWGQFLDHDIDETPVAEPPQAFDIEVPAGDPYFDPRGLGNVVIPLARSLRVEVDGVGQQANLITAFIDASNVYGSDAERARVLRTLDGTGRLATSPGGLLPFNEEGLPNAPSNSARFFLAGDFRANEQVGLTAMHTLFVREHNYWAERIARQLGGTGGPGDAGDAGDPGAEQPPGSRATQRHGSSERHAVTAEQLRRRPSGDQLFELARAIVVAEMQVITYREFLPILLGPHALTPYQGYRADVDPSIANEFATAAYRFGHTMLPPTLRRIGPAGRSIRAGDLALAEAFFRPDLLLETGIEPHLRGLAAQRAQAVDNFIIDDVRNFLFGEPGHGGFDLASLNLQRGRDHGLPSYNATRVALGLAAATSFAELARDAETARRLAAVYVSVDDVELWIGGLCEQPVAGALVGETIHALLRTQFQALRDGDRFWYESYLPRGLVEVVEAQTLARIIRRNTHIGSELPEDVFRVD